MTTLTVISAFESQLASISKHSENLATTSARLGNEIDDALGVVEQKRRTIFENDTLIAANQRKAQAVTQLIREFADADTQRERALMDYEA